MPGLEKNGLIRPDIVTAATEEYFAAQDYFARWLEACAKVDPMLTSKPSILFASFREWCGANGEPATDNRAMRGMIERTPGLKYVTNKGVQLVRGIGLNCQPDRH